MRFLALEHELPSRQVTNDEVLEGVLSASRPHLAPDELHALERMTKGVWQSTGTTVRYHRAEGERAVDVALRAGNRALANSGLQAEDVDLLIYVGIGRGVLEPATANTFQHLLGLRRATAFDVLDACASWMRALHIAHQFLSSGAYRNVMLLNAEFEGREAHRLELRSLQEFEHWHPSVTIGEAATATILTAGDEEDDFATEFRTWGEGREYCFIPLPNAEEYAGLPASTKHTFPALQFVSFGIRLMQFGAERLVEHYRDRPDVKEFDATHVFCHSASDGMSRWIAREVGADLDNVHLTHQRFANTVSASIPLAMSAAAHEGRLADGDRVLLTMASAGVTTGLATFTYHSKS